MPGGLTDPEWKAANRQLLTYRAFSTALSTLMDQMSKMSIVKMINEMITEWEKSIPKLSAESDEPKKGLTAITAGTLEFK